MTKFDIKYAEDLVEKLNNKYKKNVKFQSKEQYESCFYYNIENNIINYNNTLKLDNNQSYDYFYIDAILHEYGHAYYNQTLVDNINEFIKLDEDNCQISKFSEIINTLINNGFEIDNYPILLFRTLHEIFADYFLVKNHNTFNPNSNINLFLKQRVETIRENFESIMNNKITHFETSKVFIYYPIPPLIEKMKLEDTTEKKLYCLGIDFLNKFIDMFTMQLNNEQTFKTLENNYLSILSNILKDINNKL